MKKTAETKLAVQEFWDAGAKSGINAYKLYLISKINEEFGAFETVTIPKSKLLEIILTDKKL